jgi:hypothetical protein
MRVRAVLIPYVLSRLIVLGALATTRHVFQTLRLQEPVQLLQGLHAWDGAFYVGIARGGYNAVPKSGLRFFPLFPLAAKAVAYLPGVSASAAVVIVANVCALVAGFLIYELARTERHDDELARRAVWLLYLVPPAYVLVIGYAESTFLLLSVVVFLAVRRQHWAIAAVAGFLAGLTRPIGVLLVVPLAVEAWRERSGRGFAAATAPLLGALAYLGWAEHLTHNFLYPVRVQQAASRRGGFVDPARAIWHATHELLHGDHVSAGIHVVSAIVFLGLLVVLARRWPLSYTLYAAAVLFVSLSSRNLDSLERYGLSAVPFVLAAADVVNDDTVERVVLVASVAGLVAASVLAFTGVLVP